MTRPLFIYVKKEALQRPEVEAFVSFYLDNALTLVPDVGYIAETEEAHAKAQATFEEALRS